MCVNSILKKIIIIICKILFQNCTCTFFLIESHVIFTNQVFVKTSKAASSGIITRDFNPDIGDTYSSISVVFLHFRLFTFPDQEKTADRCMSERVDVVRV